MTVVVVNDDEHEGVVAVPRIGGEWVADKRRVTDAGPKARPRFVTFLADLPCLTVLHSDSPLNSLFLFEVKD